MPSGRYSDALLINAHTVHFKLGETDENTSELYGSQLIYLPIVIVLVLDDANFNLLAIALGEILNTRKVIPDYNPWSQLEELSANICVEHYIHLKLIIERDLFRTLKLIKFTVQILNNVNIVKSWFDETNYWVVTVEGKTVTAKYNTEKVI